MKGDGEIIVQDAAIPALPRLTVEFRIRPRPCVWCSKPIGEHLMIDSSDGRAWYFICIEQHNRSEERHGLYLIVHVRPKPVF